MMTPPRCATPGRSNGGSSSHRAAPASRNVYRATAPQEVKSRVPTAWHERSGMPLSGVPQYDLVLLHPTEVPSKDPKKGPSAIVRRRRAIAARARFVGLEVAVERSRDDDEVLLKLSAPESLLEETAERISLEKQLRSGGYTDFSRAARGSFRAASDTSIFTSMERIHLLTALLENDLSEGGCGLELVNEVANGVLLAVVPIHEVRTSEGPLMDAWFRPKLRWLPEQPLDEVRDYFGEQIAMYFGFLQCLTHALVWPSIIGCAVLLAALVYGSMDNPLTPFYSIFVLLWITGFAKTWRREEARLAYRWNMEDFEATERPRGQFSGPISRGFYTDEGYWVQVDEADRHGQALKRVRKFTAVDRLKRVAISYTLIFPLVGFVIIGTTAVLSYRSILMNSFALARKLEVHLGDADIGMAMPQSMRVTVGSVLGGALNGIFISIMNGVYAELAVRLNRWENYRTETAYEDALIIKTFFFQFVNSYTSLFYIAFIKAAQLQLLPISGLGAEYCHDFKHYLDTEAQIESSHHGRNPFCMGELATQLTSLVIVSQLISKLMEYVVPAAKARLRAYLEYRAMVKAAGGSVTSVPPMSFYEAQCKLEPFDGVFSEYSRLIIQIGYVVLFAPAFPVAALVCYLSFIVEIRTDAYKLLANTQRPKYGGAQDIGSWQKVIWLLGVVGVFTNMGLIGFTSIQFDSLLPFSFLGATVHQGNKLNFLIAAEHAILLAQYLFAHVAPDYPRETAIQRATARWKVAAAAAIAARQEGGGLNGKPPPPPPEWDDEAIPHRFFDELDAEPATAHEVRKLIKAGECRAIAAAERDASRRERELVKQPTPMDSAAACV